jgi:hypothetical protein
MSTRRPWRTWSRRCGDDNLDFGGRTVWPVTGHTDMRKGYASLTLIVQETLRRNHNVGNSFVEVVWNATRSAALIGSASCGGRLGGPIRHEQRHAAG